MVVALRRFRVNLVTLSVRRSLPVYPRKRTSIDRPVWSVSCQLAVLIVQPDAHDVDSKLQASRGDKKEAARSTWSLAERVSRLVRMATGRSSSRRHIARGDPGRLLGDALEFAKCPGADRLYLRDRSACGRRHSDRNRV